MTGGRSAAELPFSSKTFWLSLAMFGRCGISPSDGRSVPRPCPRCTGCRPSRPAPLPPHLPRIQATTRHETGPTKIGASLASGFDQEKMASHSRRTLLHGDWEEVACCVLTLPPSQVVKVRMMGQHFLKQRRRLNGLTRKSSDQIQGTPPPASTFKETSMAEGKFHIEDK